MIAIKILSEKFLEWGLTHRVSGNTLVAHDHLFSIYGDQFYCCIESYNLHHNYRKVYKSLNAAYPRKDYTGTDHCGSPMPRAHWTIQIEISDPDFFRKVYDLLDRLGLIQLDFQVVEWVS
jgi:hypothetical protein